MKSTYPVTFQMYSATLTYDELVKICHSRKNENSATKRAGTGAGPYNKFQTL